MPQAQTTGKAAVNRAEAKSSIKSIAKSSGGRALPPVVSLFAGAGGLDLGFLKAKFAVPVAFDISPAAIGTHKLNFPKTDSYVADLVEIEPAGVRSLVEKSVPIGSAIGVIGGPPCQGFSRANTASTADDPRNLLPQLYLQIVKELQKVYDVQFVVMENVLGIRDKKHAETFRKLLKGLQDLGFVVSDNALCAADYGVPQNRKRVIVCGIKSESHVEKFYVKKVDADLTVRSTIGHLPEPVFFSKDYSGDQNPIHPNHWTMNPRSKRFKDPSKYQEAARSFRRLKWDSLSPTIAFGNREIHVHPDGRRRLSIFEAMLLQGFPDSFILSGNFSQQAQQVSNAVPPPLAHCVAKAVKTSIGYK